jgi:outer membrane protein assembly factor BamE
MTLRKLLIAALCLVAVAVATTGCVYRVNISQGNYLEAKLIEQVQVGMTRSQVRFLLGTPMVADPFHPDRWDYLYYFKSGKTQKLDKQLIIIFFAEDKVERIERPTGTFKDPKQPSSLGAW